MNWLSEHWDDFLAIYGGVVAICSIIVKYTPTQKDDAILATIIKILDNFSVAYKKKD